MTDIRSAFAEYYKIERNRAEDCLGDIIKILQAADADDSARLDQILARMVKHYQRDDGPDSSQLGKSQ